MRPQKGATGLIGPGMYYQTHFKNFEFFLDSGYSNKLQLLKNLVKMNFYKFLIK